MQVIQARVKSEFLIVQALLQSFVADICSGPHCDIFDAMLACTLQAAGVHSCAFELG